METEICPEHVHMLVEIWPNINVARLITFRKLFSQELVDLLNIIILSLEEVSENMRQTSEYVAINEK